MADFTAVGLGARSPDMFGQLSQLLSIKAQSEQLRQLQQTGRQRAAMANYDWTSHLGEDGTLDLNSLYDPKLMKAAGDDYQQVVSQALTAKAHQLEAKSRLVGLRNDQRAAFADMVGGLRSDPDVTADNEKGRQKVNQALIQFGEMYRDGPREHEDKILPVLSAYSAPLKHAPKGQLASTLKGIQMQAVSAGQQLEKQQPQYTSTGAEFININPLAPPGTSPNIPLGIPPGFHVVTDPRTGNPYLLNQQSGEVRDLGQGYPGQAPAGRGSGGAAPNAPPNTPTTALPSARPSSLPRPFYPGQQHDIQMQQSAVDELRKAANKVPTNRNINAEILSLSKNTQTGPGTAAWRSTKFGGMFGDDYQRLGKYLQRSAIENMGAMGGPPSDARLDAAEAANGSTKFNPGALQAITRFNDATNSALERYRDGIDKAVGTQSPDYSALPDFQAKWAKNFDVDIFLLENAERAGDADTIKRLSDEILSKKGRATELAQKKRNLEALATTGRLP